LRRMHSHTVCVSAVVVIETRKPSAGAAGYSQLSALSLLLEYFTK
jgi:hypothetical protein